MLISKKSTAQLQEKLLKSKEIYCSGLFLSARWAVISQAAQNNINLLLLPTMESAEYCSADLYNLTEGDCVFFLPVSGKNVRLRLFPSRLRKKRRKK